MKPKDLPRLFGKVTVTLRDMRGEEVWVGRNLVVLSGRQWVASRMRDASAAVMSHLAIGTGSNAPVAGDTALQTEVARVALTSSVLAGDRMTYVASFDPGAGTGNIFEAGIFNAGAAGTMLNRIVFPLKAKSAIGYLDVVWDVRVGAAP